MVRMRSAVRICPAAPKTPDFRVFFLFFRVVSEGFLIAVSSLGTLGNTRYPVCAFGCGRRRCFFLLLRPPERNILWYGRIGSLGNNGNSGNTALSWRHGLGTLWTVTWRRYCKERRQAPSQVSSAPRPGHGCNG